MPYVSTVQAHVVYMTETRLTPISTVESREQVPLAGKQFNPGVPQPFRRPSRITLRGAIPGGVGAWGILGLQMSYVPRATEGWTDEEIRRSLFLVITADCGFEPIHIAVVYGITGAMSDINKLHANEALLSKVFAAMNAFAEAPCFIPGDFNTEPDFSVTLSTELHTGNWTDVGLIQATSLDNTPCDTYDNGRGSSSRIDLCFASACGMAMFNNLEILDDETCTVPFHKLQKLGLKSNIAKQKMPRQKKTKMLPTFEPLPIEDQEFLLMELLETYMLPLDQANEENHMEE